MAKITAEELIPDEELSAVERDAEELSAAMAGRGLMKQTVDDWLNQVDYAELNSGHYMPSTFSLMFMNFIKLVNGEEGEQNKTPVVHLAMLDQMAGNKKQIANLCHRGLGKTTVFAEYLLPYIAIFEGIEGFGEVDGIIYISDSMDNGVKSLRKNLEHRYDNSEYLREWLPEANFTDAYIEFRNKNGRKTGIKMFGAKTGIRGTKIFGNRPTLCILDDLVSDDDAKSKAAMSSIKDTVHKGVKAALHPTKRKIIFNGTPFNKNDILYESVESGAWHVNVWPVCEKFPCSREDFRGSWEDRFTYDFVQEEYQNALMEGQLGAFMQEYMLRITSAEERLVQDEEIRWYSRIALLKARNNFNFYITTDFATKGKQHNDFSVISVWAYNANGDWFWVDGICAKQTMDKNINDLFRLAQQYQPQSVGIEISGQQGAFIQWIQNEMMVRNVWFNLANGKNNQPGIQPEVDKLSRFNLVVPWFKAGKMYFPTEMRGTKVIGEFIDEMTMAMITGFKSKHDDAVDTISMLAYLKAWKPSSDTKMVESSDADGVWDLNDGFEEEELSGLSAYLG
jgi:predicted phage terminase large subunit-like protein